MKVIWHSDAQVSNSDFSHKLEIEYDFRKRMTRFLMQNPSFDCCEYYECFVFDYFVQEEKILVSQKTPEPYYSKLNSTWHLFDQDFLKKIS